jgi:hypothetical protein
MKVAILSLGLWLSAAQGFAAQACCSETPSPRKAACDGCGNDAGQESFPRPDCCTSLEAQKDVDLSVPRASISQAPVFVELLPEGGAVAPWRPESADRIADQAASRAEGPPLYLRYEVLLI